jgi:hypothetical protein
MFAGLTKRTTKVFTHLLVVSSIGKHPSGEGSSRGSGGRA